MISRFDCVVLGCAAAFYFTAASVRAQTSGSEALIAETAEDLSASVTLGYDTHYVFRGEEIFDDSLWSQLDISLPLSEHVVLGFVPFFLSSPGNAYTEIDLNPSLAVTNGEWTITAGYAFYSYPRGLDGDGAGISQEQEVTFSVARELGPVELMLLSAYNFERDGFYTEFSASASFEVSKTVSLEPSVAVGYSNHYFAVDGFSHIALSLGLPVKLNERTTLRPHLSATIPLEALENDQDFLLYGGLSLIVDF